MSAAATSKINIVKVALIAGATLAFLGVLLGAFGAHALSGKLTAYQIGIFETAIRYQFWHALALLFYGLYSQQNKNAPRLPVYLFIFGSILFSGSLFLIVFTGISRFGMITPLGGLSFLLAWGLLIIRLAFPIISTMPKE